MSEASLPPPGDRTVLADPHPPAVVADRVTVDYRIHVERRRSLQRLLAGDLREREMRRIHALKGVSFTVGIGEAVGIIGHNGSGKSSLLRAIGGLVPVTSGRVRVRSTPVLLGVRAALEPDLSARQNVFLGGTALRVPRTVLTERFDDIIEFADAEEFVDVPLRAFSSGMRAKLQFAIATAATPDILMIDEALSVGDAEFKERSDARIKEMIAEAGTVFLVSHAMRSILDVCDRVLWIDHGELVADGPAEAVVEAYRAHVDRRRQARRARKAAKATKAIGTSGATEAAEPAGATGTSGPTEAAEPAGTTGPAGASGSPPDPPTPPTESEPGPPPTLP